MLTYRDGSVPPSGATMIDMALAIRQCLCILKGRVEMAQRRNTSLPAVLASAPLQTIRAEVAGATYAFPGPELARLADRGLLQRVANGYYIVVPQDMIGRVWAPRLEAAAAGIASAI